MSLVTTSTIPTPMKSTPSLAAQQTPRPSPGTFRHPRISEIVARQHATSLTSAHVTAVWMNLLALLVWFIAGDSAQNCLNWLLKCAFLSDFSWYSSTTLNLSGALLFANLILLLRPVLPYISRRDEITDIPLTPSQRALLGLDPSIQSASGSAIPSAQYITPPKFHRLAGSTSGNSNGLASNDRRSISANYSGSPLSTSRHTLGFSPTPSQSIQRGSGSPFSPSPSASPLFHKAINYVAQPPSEVDFSASTRSFGLSTGSGLGRSQSLRERSRRDSLEPTSPSPGTRSPQIVPGLNYKWLYETGRKIPKSESFGSFGK